MCDSEFYYINFTLLFLGRKRNIGNTPKSPARKRKESDLCQGQGRSPNQGQGHQRVTCPQTTMNQSRHTFHLKIVTRKENIESAKAERQNQGRGHHLQG